MSANPSDEASASVALDGETHVLPGCETVGQPFRPGAPAGPAPLHPDAGRKVENVRDVTGPAAGDRVFVATSRRRDVDGCPTYFRVDAPSREVARSKCLAAGFPADSIELADGCSLTDWEVGKFEAQAAWLRTSGEGLGWEGVIFALTAEVRRLHAENVRLREALHDAIRRPMGTVPARAEEFYDHAEIERAEKERQQLAFVAVSAASHGDADDE